MRRLLIIVLLLALVAVGRLVWVMIPASGALLSLEQTNTESCARVEVGPGTEDVTIDQATRTVFVSSAERRDPSLPRGGIYAFSLDGDPAPVEVSSNVPADFRPHGISLWNGAGDEKRLFVINHPKAGGHTVEIFDVAADATLLHVTSVSFDEMHSPNDLVAVGPESFYASNDRGFVGGILNLIETYFALPLASAVYWDGETGNTAATGFAFANGINVSDDGQTLYIAEVLARQISVYDRDVESGELTFRSSIPVDTGPDNIEMAEDGALWVGAHPNVFDFLAHAQDPSAISPSQVLRIDPETGAVENKLIDLEGNLSASSVGAVAGPTLVVGAVFESAVLVCTLPE